MVQIAARQAAVLDPSMGGTECGYTLPSDLLLKGRIAWRRWLELSEDIRESLSFFELDLCGR